MINNLIKENPKVAILLIGQLRTFDYCVENIMKSLVEYYNADVFCHTWTTSTVESNWKRITKEEGFIFEGYEYSKSEIETKLSVLRPKKIQIDDYIEENYITNNELLNLFKDKNNHWYGMRGSRTIGQYYSLFACNELKKEYENENNFKYDIVIKTRYDAILSRPIINRQDIADIDMNFFYMNTEDSSEGVDVGLYLSNSKIIDDISTIYSMINSYFTDGVTIYDEKLFSHHLIAQNIPVRRIPIKYFLKRTLEQIIDIEINKFD